MERRCWRCRAALPPDDWVFPTPTQISSNSLKLVGNSAIKTTALAKLRRSDSDAAAVAQFVDSVENVDDIETDFDSSLCRDLDPARQADVECLVWMVLLGVGKTSAQPVSIKSVDG